MEELELELKKSRWIKKRLIESTRLAGLCYTRTEQVRLPEALCVYVNPKFRTLQSRTTNPLGLLHNIKVEQSYNTVCSTPLRISFLYNKRLQTVTSLKEDISKIVLGFKSPNINIHNKDSAETTQKQLSQVKGADKKKTHLFFQFPKQHCLKLNQISQF